ncbi:reverse transcriptase [Phytophthora cinnamomi]|uniref:reverse transcriptase n=1 Tax=Phytophthora cinnamomi TaxID=4785 RepID=UPI00355A287B|nr:reverse transcriptase [Phytophthora cinnamomi]
MSRLDFEEVNVPRSLLEVRLATGAIVKTEKRVGNVRFSYKQRVFVEYVIVLDLDYKFDVVMGMPWLARYDPIIDWKKRTLVCFSRDSGTEIDGPVTAAHAPAGARGSPVETALNAAVPECPRSVRGRTQARPTSAMLPTSEEKDVLVPGTNTHVQVRIGQSLTRKGQVDNGASAPGADAPSVMRGSANEWRRGDEGVSTPGVDAANSADGCKRTALTQFACCRAAGLHDEAPCDQAGLDIARPQTRSAGEGTHYRAAGLHEGKCGQAGLDTARPRTGSAGERLSTAGPGPEEQLCGAGLRTTRRRRKRKTLRKSRSGTETQQEQSAQQTAAVTPNVKTLSVLTRTDTGFQYREMELASPPTTASELTSLPAMSWKRFTRDFHDGRIDQVCVLSDSERTASENKVLRQLFMGSTTESEDTLSAKTKRERFEEQGWDSLKSSPYYELLREYKDVLPEEIPAELPQDKGIQHEIDLVPGTKYCVTRQWPLPREQVKAIDDFFESRRKAGQVRESKSPHSDPMFCVKKPQGGSRIVHAYNKLNDATVPAQTPIPRKDVIIDSMAGSTVYSALDLRDGFYQILIRESDIPITAVSTPSGMLWERLVMPQGLQNAPVTFNTCVTHLLRSVRDFAPSYFDDVFIHSRAVDEKTDVEMHRVHLRKLLELMLSHKLYANQKKCIFGASEIPVLGCLVGKNGVRPDPEKVRVINEWPTPSSVKERRQFLGLATYLCKYVEDYAGKIRPLSQLLKKEAVWNWTPDCQKTFDAVKRGLTEAPILAVADQDRPFHVVCDASDFTIGCALMQHDHEGRDRVVYYQSR